MATHRLDETAAGVYVICATPFADNGDLDLASTKGLIDLYTGSGTLRVCSTLLPENPPAEIVISAPTDRS